MREIFVDDDVAALGDLDARRLEAEPGDVRRAAGGEHHAIGGRARSRWKGARKNALSIGSIAATLQPVTILMPCRLHVHPHMRTHIIVEAAQDIVAAIDDRHVGAQAGKDAGEFERDIAAALDDDVLRKLLQMEGLVRGDRVLDAGNRIAIGRRAAGGDQNVGRAHAPAVGKLDAVGSETTARVLTTVTPAFSSVII